MVDTHFIFSSDDTDIEVNDENLKEEGGYLK